MLKSTLKKHLTSIIVGIIITVIGGLIFEYIKIQVMPPIPPPEDPISTPEDSTNEDLHKLELQLDKHSNRYTTPDTGGIRTDIFAYKVPQVWKDYIKRDQNLTPLTGNIPTDLMMLDIPCNNFSQSSDGACIIGRQLAWDCEFGIGFKHGPSIGMEPDLFALEFCKWNGPR